jgi:hypothetical protein
LPQANSNVQLANQAAELGRDQARSWWRTLPGMFTAAAGLISAITGLIVAIQQLRPASHEASATSTESAGVSTPATSATERPSAIRVQFPAGRHVEANGGLRYDVLSASTRAGNPGEATLALRVRLTNPSRFPANFWNASFRLRIGADTSEPSNFLDDVVNGGTTDIGEIDFTVATTTGTATLLVGDDPAHAIALPLRLTGGSS